MMKSFVEYIPSEQTPVRAGDGGDARRKARGEVAIKLVLGDDIRRVSIIDWAEYFELLGLAYTTFSAELGGKAASLSYVDEEGGLVALNLMSDLRPYLLRPGRCPKFVITPTGKIPSGSAEGGAAPRADEKKAGIGVVGVRIALGQVARQVRIAARAQLTDLVCAVVETFPETKGREFAIKCVDEEGDVVKVATSLVECVWTAAWDLHAYLTRPGKRPEFIVELKQNSAPSEAGCISSSPPGAGEDGEGFVEVESAPSPSKVGGNGGEPRRDPDPRPDPEHRPEPESENGLPCRPTMGELVEEVRIRISKSTDPADREVYERIAKIIEASRASSGSGAPGGGGDQLLMCRADVLDQIEKVVDSGDVGALEYLLRKSGGSVDCIPVNKYIFQAATKGHADMVGQMIRWGSVDDMQVFLNALMLAVDNHHDGVVDVLLERGDKFGQVWVDEALKMAVFKDRVDLVSKLIKERRANPAFFNNLPLQYACSHGHVEIVRVLLEHDQVCASDRDNYALRFAAKNGHAEVVEMLLEKDVDPNAKDEIAIRDAIAGGHARVVEVLLKDERTTLKCITKKTIRAAVRNGHVDVIRQLLDDGRLVYTMLSGEVMRVGVMHNKSDILRVLLERMVLENDDSYIARINRFAHLAIGDGHMETVRVLLEFTDKANEMLVIAARKNQPEIVSMLLGDARICPAHDDNVAIREACKYGSDGSVPLLLADERVDPAAKNNEAIVQAAERGHDAVVGMLLADKRVDPAVQDNAAIIGAARNGYDKVVDLLVKDERVAKTLVLSGDFIRQLSTLEDAAVLNLLRDFFDPMIDINRAIADAAARGKADIVRSLLENPDCNPGYDNNAALRRATRNGHVEVVHVLMTDERVGVGANGTTAHLLLALENKLLSMPRSQS